MPQPIADEPVQDRARLLPVLRAWPPTRRDTLLRRRCHGVQHQQVRREWHGDGSNWDQFVRREPEMSWFYRDCPRATGIALPLTEHSLISAACLGLLGCVSGFFFHPGKAVGIA